MPKRTIAFIAVILGFMAGSAAIRGVRADTSKLSVIVERTFRAQTADLPETTVFTPSRDGDFLVSVYIATTMTPDQGGSVCATLNYTDDYLTQSYPQVSTNITGRPLCGGPNGELTPQLVPIRAKGGTPITIQTTAGFPGGIASQYSLYVKVIGF